MKSKIINTIMLMQFVSLEDFHKQLLFPGESFTVYIHQIKQLLTQVMPGIGWYSKRSIFIAPIPFWKSANEFVQWEQPIP